MIAERDARQATIIIVMDASIAALRTRRMLLGLLVISPARAPLVAVEMRFLLRQRQGDAGFQHGVAADLQFRRMRHHRVDDFRNFALTFLLLLARTIMPAGLAMLLACRQGSTFQALDRDAWDRGAQQLLDRGHIFAVYRCRQAEGMA